MRMLRGGVAFSTIGVLLCACPDPVSKPSEPARPAPPTRSAPAAEGERYVAEEQPLDRGYVQVLRATELAPASARLISELVPFAGRLFIGHGDTAANLGPTPLYAYDPRTGTLERIAHLDEHGIDRAIVSGGELLIPGSEPCEPATSTISNYAFGNFYRIAADGTRHKTRGLKGAVHELDIAVFGERIFVAGSVSGTEGEASIGRVFVSDDRGARWQTAFDIKGPTKAIVRAGALLSLGGSLYAFGLVFDPKNEGEADPFGEKETFVWTDGTLERRDLLPPGYLAVDRAVVFKDRGFVVVRMKATDRFRYELYEIDGHQSWARHRGEPEILRDVFATDQRLYLLSIEPHRQRVLATTDGKTFELAAAVPRGHNVFSIAVIGTSLYLGTAEGRILRTSLARTKH